MLKRILLALDCSASGLQAKHLAINLAAEYKAQLTGMGILDIPWITAAQPEPIGGTAYKLYRDQEVISQMHERLESLMKEFKRKCKAQHVECNTLEAKGLPTLELERSSQEHDIIIMGKNPEFHFELDSDNDIVVRHIARDNPRPLIITPGSAKEDKGRHILIAYDGSLQAARSLHIFLLLGLARGKPVHIISVDDVQTDAVARAQRAQRMCESHGVQATSQGLDSKDDLAQIILATAYEKKAQMIVLGAFGWRGLRDLFFGSAASQLIKDADIPLFIHH
jgi:nucleotide-binding universal stress UspA family protein